MDLLERDQPLQLLSAALGEMIAGAGRIALVSGEAGIGKTSFVERFLALHCQNLRVLKGHCDALFTPSPLGPLYDIARQTGGQLVAQLHGDTPRAALFSTVLDQLRGVAQPVVLVIEDIHWADEATLDLVKYLSRRIDQVRALVILTYRDDEGSARYVLRTLLGDLAMSPAVVRIELPRLSLEAVRTLVAASPLDAAALHGQTAGNPFFVSELLSHAGRGLPATVRDAVLAKVARLPPGSRDVLETVAVLGSRIEHAVLDRVLGQRADAVTDCMKAGLLDAAGQGTAFRHELVRDAILGDLDPARRRQLNRLALDSLRASAVGRGGLAMLAQFAEAAGDSTAVLEFGLAAARAAASVGAHRAAAAQYRRVLAFADDCTPAARAELLESYAEECSTVDDLAEAVRARREAVALRRATGDPLREGANLAALASALVGSGQNAAAEEASRRSIDVLGALPASRELATAYRIQAHLRLLNRDKLPAVRWGRKAIALATKLDDISTIAASEMVVGAAMLVTGDEGGCVHLERSLVLARQAGLDNLIAVTHMNTASSWGEQYRFDKAEENIAIGVPFATERDLDYANHYMHAWLAITRLYQGRWNEAGEIAASLVERPNAAAITRIMALITLGRVRARRGDPGAWTALDEALEMALQTDTLQRLAPARAARAEAAWLAGDQARMLAEATACYELAARYRHRWYTGEFAFWRWRGGEAIEAPGWSARPFLLQIKGEWRRAAQAWKELGCPYEEARALADGDAPAQIEALEILDRLGALPAAAALRQRMRGGGMRRIPRGPRATTRGNPFGLTAREMQILRCLTAGLSNGRIGEQLHVSPKTVDHHVSAVLSKLGAATRGEAAQIAREQNLLAQNGEAPAAK